MYQSEIRKHIALVESYNQENINGINEQDRKGPPSRQDLEQSISRRNKRVAPGMFIVMQDNNRYEIPMEMLPCKGVHGAAEEVSRRHHPRWGDYIQFYITCSPNSREPGREYSVQYWIKNGTVSSHTVN